MHLMSCFFRVEYAFLSGGASIRSQMAIKGEFWSEGGQHVIEIGLFLGGIPGVKLQIGPRSM